MTNAIGMTPSYCSPEVKTSDYSSVTTKSDIFSAGMFVHLIFYLMLEFCTK